MLSLLLTAEGGWGSRRRRRTVCETVPESILEGSWQCSPVLKTRQVWKEQMRFRNQSRTVTKYDNATRLLNQTRTISYTLPLEDFFHMALEEISEEIRCGIVHGRSAPTRRPTANQSEATDDGEAVVMFGRTQVGKSTAACQLRTDDADACPAVGDGSGDSVTEVAGARNSKIGLLCDTPGIDDTQLRFTKEEAGKLVALGIAEAGVRRVKFAVFECLSNTAMHLRDTLASLESAFGATALSGAIIVASMANEVSSSYLARRLAKIQEVASNSGIHEVVTWRGPKLFEEDLSALRAALSRVEAVPITELEDLWGRRDRRAAELHAAQVPRTEEILVEVEQTYTIERQEELWEEIPYTVQEQFPEEYEISECGTVTQARTVMANRCREL